MLSDGPTFKESFDFARLAWDSEWSADERGMAFNRSFSQVFSSNASVEVSFTEQRTEYRSTWFRFVAVCLYLILQEPDPGFEGSARTLCRISALCEVFEPHSGPVRVLPLRGSDGIIT